MHEYLSPYFRDDETEENFVLQADSKSLLTDLEVV